MRHHGSLVFLGNCQAAALRVAYNRYVVEPNAAPAVSIDAREMSQAHRKQIEAADTIVAQVADMNGAFIGALSGLRARIVLFPYVSGFFFWPFATEAHPSRGRGALSRYPIYGAERGGDAFLNRLLRAGTSAEAAVDIYRSLDFDKACRFGRRYDVMMRAQQARDERTGTETAAFIQRNLGKDRLFATRGHLTAPMFLHLATQVFDRLGVPSQALWRLEANLLRAPVHDDDVPIHPALLRRFGYPSVDDEQVYQFDGIRQSFDEYVVRYMTSRCEFDVQDALRIAGLRKPAEIVALLHPRLAERRFSGRVLLSLSHALDQLLRHDEAMAAARQAVELYPTEPDLLLHLARQQFYRRSPEEAEAVLRAMLALRPDNCDANYMLAVALEKQGFYPEALRHMRRARACGRLDWEAALRHARLALRAGNLQAARDACHDALHCGGLMKEVEPILGKIRAAGEQPAERTGSAAAAE